MHETLRVTWRVTPLQPPLVRRHCSRCSGETPFACSMKFRTNAQKKRVDVWLIYRCSICEDVWNLPIFERMNVGDIPANAFDAIARNEPMLVLRHAFDRARLMRHGTLEERPDVLIRKLRDTGCALEARVISIVLALALPSALRLDRLLKIGLGVSRAQLGRLHDAGQLCLSPGKRRALRNSIAHGQIIEIDLAPLEAVLVESLRRRALI